MPKVIGYTPPWLSRPSPGAKIFSNIGSQQPEPSSGRQSTSSRPTPEDQSFQRTTRLIAHRGTEIFTVVGNTLRWADLAQVKENWESQGYKQPSLQKNQAPEEKIVYRTLKTTVHYQFTELVISPSGHFLAICTEHAVHIAILPDSSRLHDQDRSDIKLKTHQLGPTTHVIPEAPLAAVLWHPLAASTPTSDCLVTVATDAAVRLWEFDRMSYWSFDRPALAIDLRKLADGTSCDQDFEPLTFGKKHGFTADDFDMEASAACFGGYGEDFEDPWASMTLWTAMTNGDVYALCPLLPSKWQPSSTTIPALTTSTVSEKASMRPGEGDIDEQRAADQRYEWVQEIDNDEESTDDRIRPRPHNPSAIPRLQGPFELPFNAVDDDLGVSDILVMPRSLDEEDVFSGEDDYDFISGSKTLPFSIICIATKDDKIHILLELDGVTGQWLPRKGRSTFSVPTADAGELVLVESVKLKQEPDMGDSWPRFTQDPTNPYVLFITAGSRVVSLSLEDWISKVGFEVAGEDKVDKGLHTRLAIACQGSIASLTSILPADESRENRRKAFTAVALVESVDIGTMLLTCTGGEAAAAQLDQNQSKVSQMVVKDAREATQSPFRRSQSVRELLTETNDDTIDGLPTRAPYVPDSIFYTNQMQPYEEFKARIPAHRRHLLTDQPIKLSPACLDLMAAAHRTFSHQTANIETAAAELFRRCERLREELAEQVRQMSEIANRMQNIRTKDEDDDKKQMPLEERITNAETKQKDLVVRYENLRKKAGRVGSKSRDLSNQENNWIQEIDNLSKYVGSVEKDGQPSAAESLRERYQTVRELTQELLEQSHKYEAEQSKAGSTEVSGSATPTAAAIQQAQHRSTPSLSSRVQRERIAEAMAMVDRETAIIDAVMFRLDKLNVA